MASADRKIATRGSIIEALRERSDRIRYVGVRHEEAAAFMASGFAKHTGRLGVCLGTTGPGAIHLLNGLYDAAFDGAQVVALTGLTLHDLGGVRYQQSVDSVRLMQSVALYNEEVTGPEHAVIVGNRARRPRCQIIAGQGRLGRRLAVHDRCYRRPGDRAIIPGL